MTFNKDLITKQLKNYNIEFLALYTTSCFDQYYSIIFKFKNHYRGFSVPETCDDEDIIDKVIEAVKHEFFKEF